MDMQLNGKRKAPKTAWTKETRPVGVGAGRPKAVHCIPDLLRWAGALNAPEALVAKMRTTFNIPADKPLTIDQATILRSRLEALGGDIQHLEFWAKRTEGNVTDRLKVDGAGLEIAIYERIVEADDAQDAGNTTPPSSS